MASTRDFVKAHNEMKIDKEAFRLRNDNDDLRVDSLCRELLQRYYAELLSGGAQPADATAWASGADYFLRDFVVDRKRASVFDELPGLVRQFAGNWYIVTTVEPNMAELSLHLQGICGFYQFLHAHGFISDSHLREVETECADMAYYEGRIESFWNLGGDGYSAWERECTLKG